MENGEQPPPQQNQTVPAEADLPVPEGQAPDQDVALLLEDARSKADEHWNQLLLAKADLENLRRRGQRDLENAHKYALERFAADLLPVKDSLELGLEATSVAAADPTPELKKLRDGMELTHKLLKAAMEKFSIKEINPVGEKFNPQFHQAMSMQEAPDTEPNTVLITCQKGYLLHDRLIRPAMVIVAKPAESQASPA